MAKLAPKYRDWWTTVSSTGASAARCIHSLSMQFLNQYDDLVERSLGPGIKLSGYHLQVIGVSPDHQRKGAAAALMNYAEGKVRTNLPGYCR